MHKEKKKRKAGYIVVTAIYTFLSCFFFFIQLLFEFENPSYKDEVAYFPGAQLAGKITSHQKQITSRQITNFSVKSF